MSIIFFRFFLLFSVVANRVGPKTRYHRACSRSLTSLVLSRSLLRYCTKLCLLGFSAISASFSRNFSGLWAGLGSCFVDFYGFSYFFLDFFQLLGLVVHYANLVLLNKYTFLTECRYARPGHRWRTRTLLQAHSETF